MAAVKKMHPSTRAKHLRWFANEYQACSDKQLRRRILAEEEYWSINPIEFPPRVFGKKDTQDSYPEYDSYLNAFRAVWETRDVREQEQIRASFSNVMHEIVNTPLRTYTSTFETPISSYTIDEFLSQPKMTWVEIEREHNENRAYDMMMKEAERVQSLPLVKVECETVEEDEKVESFSALPWELREFCNSEYQRKIWKTKDDSMKNEYLLEWSKNKYSPSKRLYTIDDINHALLLWENHPVEFNDSTYTPENALASFLHNHECSVMNSDFATHTNLAGTFGLRGKQSTSGKYCIPHGRARNRFHQILAAVYQDSGLVHNLNEVGHPSCANKLFLDIEDKTFQAKFTTGSVRRLVAVCNIVLGELLVLSETPVWYLARNSEYRDYKIHLVCSNVFVTMAVQKELVRVFKQRLHSTGIGKYLDVDATGMRMLTAMKWDKDNMKSLPEKGVYFPECRVDNLDTLLRPNGSLSSGGSFKQKYELYAPIKRKNGTDWVMYRRGKRDVAYKDGLTPQTFEDFSIHTREPCTPLKDGTYFKLLMTRRVNRKLDTYLNTLSSATVREMVPKLVSNLSLRWAVGRNGWLTVGRILFEVFGRNGLPLFTSFSNRSVGHAVPIDCMCRDKPHTLASECAAFQKFEEFSRKTSCDSDSEDEDREYDSDDDIVFTLDSDSDDEDSDDEENDDVGQTWKVLVTACAENRKLSGFDFKADYNYECSEYIREMYTDLETTHHADKKYVDHDDIIKCPSDKVFLAKAMLGGGKTTALFEALKQTKLTWVWIVPRCTHAASIYQKAKQSGLDCVFYQDVQHRYIHQNVVIQYESLHRLYDQHNEMFSEYDVVICDEIESLYNQCVSVQTCGKNIDLNMKVLTHYLKSPFSRKWFADAFLSTRTLDMMDMFGLDYEVHSYATEVKPRNVVKYDSEGKWEERLYSALNGDKKCFFFFSSLEKMKRVYKCVSDNIKPKILLYSSEHGGIDIDKNVEEHWSTYQFIWCTSTVTIGLSYDLKDFQDIFVYHSNQSGVLSRDMMQALYRVRCILGNVHLYMDTTYPNFVKEPICERDLVQYLQRRIERVKKSYEHEGFDITVLGQSIESLMFRCTVFTLRERSVNARCFEPFTNYLFQQAGYTISEHVDTELTLIKPEDEAIPPFPEANGIRQRVYATLKPNKRGYTKTKDERLASLVESFLHHIKTSAMEDETRDECWLEYAKETSFKQRVVRDRIMNIEDGYIERLKDSSEALVLGNGNLAKYHLFQKIREYFKSERTDVEMDEFLTQHNKDFIDVGISTRKSDESMKKNHAKTVIDKFLWSVSFGTINRVQQPRPHGEARVYSNIFARKGDYNEYVNHKWMPIETEDDVPSDERAEKRKNDGPIVTELNRTVKPKPQRKQKMLSKEDFLDMARGDTTDVVSWRLHDDGVWTKTI